MIKVADNLVWVRMCQCCVLRLGPLRRMRRAARLKLRTIGESPVSGIQKPRHGFPISMCASYFPVESLADVFCVLLTC